MSVLIVGETASFPACDTTERRTGPDRHSTAGIALTVDDSRGRKLDAPDAHVSPIDHNRFECGYLRRLVRI
jgi:hypothetical protein